MTREGMTRRGLLSYGALGLTLPSLLEARASARQAHARSCIVLFAWGGMSHLDTWDPKPDAGSDIRGLFQPIRTSVPGIHVSEQMPHLAKQMHRLAIVRSAHHNAPSHRSAAYWNLTGHAPADPGKNWPRSREDWPCLGSMVAKARASDVRTGAALSGAYSLPYPMADGGMANGQHAGFLGVVEDPVIVRPPGGRMYEGVSPEAGWVDLGLQDGVKRERLVSRRALLGSLDASGPEDHYRDKAMDMLTDPKVKKAFDLDGEPERVRKAYGSDHICGRSVLQARKLVEAGVPLVTVCCAAGDLNGSKGAHWDTHADNFNKIKNHMMPPLDLAGAALLSDLADRGMLDETLVVFLTEFGRTPKINKGAGRDHYPNCYSVAYAGGGIAGGQVYGRSDKIGSEPAESACGPPDLHATVFRALGIDRHFQIRDREDRPYSVCDGAPLPLFG